MTDSTVPFDPAQVLPHAIAAARDAGKAVLDVYKSNFAVEHKDDNSPVTLADRRSHNIIVERLCSIDNKSIPILSEEGKSIPYEVRKGWEYFWIVDPLDGTKEFIKRNGEFTINIALILRQRPVLGVIYIPVTETLYVACEGSGAYKESTECKAALPMPRTRGCYTIVGSRSHATPELAALVEKMRVTHGEVDFISAGSSLKFCLVAEGTADIYPRFGPTMEWDTAAGQAIVEQAGGAVIRMNSSELLRYNKPELLNPRFSAQRDSLASVEIGRPAIREYEY